VSRICGYERGRAKPMTLVTMTASYLGLHSVTVCDT
jgi:hypothetical protein